MTIEDRIVQRVAELPDRTSPDDWPEAMLVTAEELRTIIADEMTAARLGFQRMTFSWGPPMREQP